MRLALVAARVGLDEVEGREGLMGDAMRAGSCCWRWVGECECCC